MSGSGDHRGGGPPGSDDGWEIVGKKKRSGRVAGRQRAPQSSTNATPNTARTAWGGNGAANRGNPRPPPQAPRPVPTPSLANGRQWPSGPRPSGSEVEKDDAPPTGSDREVENVDDNTTSHDDDDLGDDTSDDYDSDASEKSFETRKMNKWFKKFFEDLNKLSVEQINEQTKSWHCPACQNGPGAIDRYKGLQPLVTHARTKGTRRVRLHREFAALLEEELSRRGTSAVPAGEQFGKWKGLRESTDREIVWPPMVIVMNTLLEKDDDDKWKGMGNQELLDYFKDYAVTKARHAYGPSGHRGMGLLLFESSAVGYIEAERLHRHFVAQGTDRNAWNLRKDRFVPGGKRQLHGFLASKEDMEMKQMSEDNQQLNYLKNKMVKTEQRSKAVEETLGIITQKLRETMEENVFVKRKAKEKHLEYEEEMKHQEEFFHSQIEGIHKATEDKEKRFEKLLQEERSKARRFDVDSGTTEEDRKLRKEHVQKFIDCQVKNVAEFEAERDELIKGHEEKKMKLKKQYMEKELELERDHDAALTALMEKHKPDTFEASSS
ncbi:Protein SUPPRESSOR OF GENE SILENCING 3 [Zea mays]|uniref:Protein SUPPRESSOR OF GENE SILENCING 3 n=1 Tax=Zea mays TaxID=4577 RepID=A0A1D6MY81_MAIZE|nr:Protein SUPPRESSOR OF GENE SILENCING 3 [Zea mays]